MTSPPDGPQIPGAPTVSDRTSITATPLTRASARRLKSPPPAGRNTKSPRAGIINRDASKSQKGPQLQRLRAAHFIFEAIADSTVSHCYAAVEAVGDASVRTARPDGSNTYSEEDKAYDASSLLSFASEAVLNTMVIFLDQWFDSGLAKNVRFGFFTPAGIAAEANSDRTRRLSISPPASGILKQLAEGRTRDAELVECVRALVLDEYATQYKDHPLSGHHDKIEAWTGEDWITFLSLIDWRMSAPDEHECENRLLKDVKACRFYKPCHQDREEYIASRLTALLESKQRLSDPLDRRVSDSDVENIFLKLQHEPDIRPTDATWQAWQRLPAPVDQRGLVDKFGQACSRLSRSTLDRYQRQAADALLEFDAHSQDKNVLAMRYQIYDVCESELARILSATTLTSESDLVALTDSLVTTALQRVEARARDYAYKVTNPAFVRNIVYSLFQECYLSLQSSDTPEER